MPRRWRNWGIGAAAVLAVALAVGIPTVARSDMHTVAYHAAAHRPAAAPAEQTPSSARQLWSAAGIPSAGGPATASTVLIAGGHGITGRDPRTGAVRWSYRRGNADLCGWVLMGTTAVAVFHDGTDCSDLTGFDADTGRRLWYLNADLPSSIDLLPGSSLYYAATTGKVSGFYVDGGSSAWTFTRRGCTFGDVASGDVGLLLVTRCSGRAPTLICLDGFTGKLRWQISLPGSDPHLLGADRSVLVVSRIAGRVLLSLYGSDGRPAGTLDSPALTVPTATTTLTTGPPTSVVGRTVLSYDGRRVLAVDVTHNRLVWSAPALGPAVAAGGTAYVPRTGGFTGYEVSSGHAVAQISAPGTTAPVQRAGAVGGRLVTVSVARTRVFG